jgi:hypothetical protein
VSRPSQPTKPTATKISGYPANRSSLQRSAGAIPWKSADGANYGNTPQLPPPSRPVRRNKCEGATYFSTLKSLLSQSFVTRHCDDVAGTLSPGLPMPPPLYSLFNLQDVNGQSPSSLIDRGKNFINATSWTLAPFLGHFPPRTSRSAIFLAFSARIRSALLLRPCRSEG